MPTVSDLHEEAKAAGHTGYSKLRKDDLLALLGYTEQTGEGHDPGEAVEVAVGETGSLDGDESAEETPPVGVPTEPERGGLNPDELAAFEPPGPPPAPTSTRRSGPSITGSYQAKEGIGIPTEPERGGLTETERELHGAT